jgi:hypothetical protein
LEKTINSLITKLQDRIQVIRNEQTLYEEINFERRAEAMDILEFHIIDTIETLLQKKSEKGELNLLKVQAGELKRKMENIDKKLFLKLNEELRKANDKTSFFREIIFNYLESCIAETGRSDKIGYDNFDVFVNNLIPGFNSAFSEPTMIREPEMVFYQKTPARIVFEMSKLIGTEGKDVFFDLGSGLGQVVILLSLITGITAKGVEIESQYCDYATECALQLGLPGVEFINDDARNPDYSEGTLFYLYTPFKGKMLLDMMNVLQQVAQKKTIRVFTYGPCAMQVAQQHWLQCTNGKAKDFYKLCEFKSLPH